MTTRDSVMMKQITVGLLLMCLAGIATHATYNNASIDRVIAIEKRQESQAVTLRRIDDNVRDLHMYLISTSKPK